MTNPYDPEGGSRPPGPAHGQQPGPYQPGPYQPGPYQPGPYQPGPYGQGPYPQPPGQYGQPPYGSGPYGGVQQAPGQSTQGNPHPGPYGAAELAYSPYGAPYPTATGEGDAEPVSRPGIMILSLVLLILGVLPFLAFGVVLLFLPFTAETLPQELVNNPQLVDAGATPDLIIQVIRTGGGIILAVSLIYLLLAVLAFMGRNGARIVLTILTVALTMVLVAALVGGAGADPGSLAFLLLVIAASVGGVGILFSPASSRFFSRARR